MMMQAKLEFFEQRRSDGKIFDEFIGAITIPIHFTFGMTLYGRHSFSFTGFK